MFITSELTPIELLSELLDRRTHRDSETDEFRKLRHNRDLCPKFAENIKTALEFYLSHYTDAQDIQGIKDEGVDVLVKFSWDKKAVKAGLQVKSFKEIEDWIAKRNKNFLENLKAQAMTAVLQRNVNPYYIVVCTDELKHQDQLRLIKAEFSHIDQVRVIEPRHALSFYKMDRLDIVVTVTRLLCASDPVLNTSSDEVDNMPPGVAFVLLHALCKGFEQNLKVTSDDMSKIYDEWAKPTSRSGKEKHRRRKTTLGEILGDLDQLGVIQDGAGDFCVDLRELSPALCALYFDHRFRHAHDTHTMADYLCALLDVK